MAYGDVVVLEDVDLTVAGGEIVALTGVNGVGKSTLLSCIVARAVLPSLLSGCWLAIALTVLCAAGTLSGWLWPLLGLAAGPGVAAGVLRMARTARINPADRGPDTPMGNTPPWLVSRMLSVIVAVIGTAALVGALLKGEAHATTVIDQCAASVIVLWIYLVIARALSR